MVSLSLGTWVVSIITLFYAISTTIDIPLLESVYSRSGSTNSFCFRKFDPNILIVLVHQFKVIIRQQ